MSIVGFTGPSHIPASIRFETFIRDAGGRFVIDNTTGQMLCPIHRRYRNDRFYNSFTTKMIQHVYIHC